MNNVRRKAIDDVHSRLLEVVDILEDLESGLLDIAEEEGEAIDNLPESLQESDRANEMNEFKDMLEDASYNVGDARSTLDDVIGNLWDIIEPLYQKK